MKKITVLIFAILVLIPVVQQISLFIKDEIKRKNRNKFWKSHNEFLSKCDDIQDDLIKIQALTWLLDKWTDSWVENANLENFKEEFYKMWGEHIPEYRSEILKIKRDKKIKDLGL